MVSTLGSLGLPMLCAAVMGISIQRGSTCAVAAVEEAVLERKGTRLFALLEGAAWVTGILLAAYWAFGIERFPPGFDVTWLTVLGGVVFGVGAFLNQACAMGTIVGVANGNWTYVFTLVGMYGGYASHHLLGGTFTKLDPREPLAVSLAIPLVVAFALLFGWRLRYAYAMVRAHGALRRALRQAWVPHTAVSVTGSAFAIGAILFQPWAYTELLHDLALDTGEMRGERAALTLTLFGGALLAGRMMKHWQPVRAKLLPAARCALGGAVMAWGSILIPGQNENLLLVGMPMLRPHAWAASACMIATIAVLIALQRRMQRR